MILPSKKQILFVLVAALQTGCSEPTVPGGRVTVRNDILDKEFNSFVVDEVLTSAGAAGFRKVFKPGESATLPMKHITGMRFTRRYPDHSKVYVVKCPEDSNSVVTIKLIDVHTNRMKGGCVLTKKGETRSGSTIWED